MSVVELHNLIVKNVTRTGSVYKERKSVGIFFLFFLFIIRDPKVMAEKWLLRHSGCPHPLNTTSDKDSWRDIVSLHMALHFRDPKDLGASHIFQ